MSKELWKQVTDNIDERFADEAAEYFAKHSNVEFVEDSASSYDGKALSLSAEKPEKKQSKGKVIAIICAAAAAVALCVFGGIHLMKGENPLLPADTSTTEASDTLETLETGEITDVEQSEINSVEMTVLTLVNVINEDDIIAQAGFDIPIDMEEHGDEYQAAIDYANSLPDGPDKQRYIEQNYLTVYMMTECYVGSDTADWICTINYDFCTTDGFTVPFYSRVFYVKNGHITETVFEADSRSYLDREGKYIYIENGNDGLFMLNTDTMVIQAITADPAHYYDSNDEYVLFANYASNTYQVYVRESGEIIPTDIYKGEYDGTRAHLMGDRIRYRDVEDDDIYDFMLPSGELQAPEVGLGNAFPLEQVYDNEFYDIEVSEDRTSITINDLQAGTTEELHLSELAGEYGYGGFVPYDENIALYKHTLYLSIAKGGYDIAVLVKYDIPTKRAVYAPTKSISGTNLNGEHLIGALRDVDEVTGNTSYSYGKVIFGAVSSEEQTDEWASVDFYRGDDVSSIVFKNALSESVKEKNQAVYDDYVNNVGEDGLTDEDLMMIDQLQYGVTTYYVGANDGAEFWLKRYMRKGGQFFDFTEIYLRKDGEFKYIETVDWLDVLYNGETLVRCSGDYLYYSHDDGIVERISTNGEKERVFDVKQYAMEDLPEPLETISLWAEGTTMRGSGDVLELTYRYVHNSSELDFSTLRESRVHIDTDNKVLKQEHGAVGISIVDGEGVPFEVIARKHQHDPKQMLADDLMYLGREKLSDAIKLYQIKAGEGVSSDLESYEDIKTLFDSTFAGDMYNYADHYYASGEPMSAPWYDDNDRLKESLWSSIDGKVDHNGELVYDLGGDASDECWTMLYGVLDNGVDFVDYGLCTIRKNTSNSISSSIPYYYELSVMRLEKSDGEWKITQLRTRLGNEYGTEQRDKLIELGYDDLQYEDRSYTEIVCKLLRNDGHEVIGTSVEDFDFDGVDELFVLTEKNDSKVIRVYEQQSYGWEFKELISGQYRVFPEAAQFIRYDDGYEHYYYTVSDGFIEIISLDETDNAYSEIDANNGNGFSYKEYNTPIEYPGVLYALFERYPESEPNYYEFAEQLVSKWIAALTDKSTYKERTFNIINWDVKDIKVIPIAEAPFHYNVTEAERALENAWIVEPEVWYTYEGRVNGKRGDPNDWYESIGADNIGFLMWQEGDTFFMRSRWLNCGTKELMTDDELQAFLDENLQPALSFTELVYFSGDNAREAGMTQIEDSLYEVAPDFPYSSTDEIKADAAKYFSEDAVEQLDIDFWFPVIDGKLCARTFNKGLSCSGYTAENAEVLSQYSFYTYDKVVIKLKMTDWLTKDQYSGDGYGVVTLVYDGVKGKWLFEEPLI